MNKHPPAGPLKIAFETQCRRLLIADIQPLRTVGLGVKRTVKYAQILASVKEIGIIEPPVVWPLDKFKNKYLLLEGHLRIEVLKDLGKTDVVCLIATDDEAYTYNKHISRLATIQEHKMILKVIERGVSKERIAQALNVDPNSLNERIRLLEGICPEATELLKDKHVAFSTFRTLRKMHPLRQIEVAESMVAMNCYTASYARSLLAATPQAQLVDTEKPKRVKSLSAKQMTLMERESSNLDREYRLVEEFHGTNHLNFVIACGYLRKLLSNDHIVNYLAQYHEDLLPELQKLVDMGKESSTVSGASA
jgi:hypothetical protein